MRTGPSMVILSTDWWQLLRQERRAIAGRTARCRCKFRYVITYSAVYLRIQKWKNYWNRSTFARVIVKIKVTLFYGPWCSLYCYSTNSLWNGRIKISLRKPNSSFVQFVVFWCHVDQLTVSAVRPATGRCFHSSLPVAILFSLKLLRRCRGGLHVQGIRRTTNRRVLGVNGRATMFYPQLVPSTESRQGGRRVPIVTDWRHHSCCPVIWEMFTQILWTPTDIPVFLKLQ